MSDLERYYGDGTEDIVADHRNNCICCGGRTSKDDTIVLNETTCDFYKCRVCSTQIAQDDDFIYMEAEPERFEHVISDEYSNIEWTYTDLS